MSAKSVETIVERGTEAHLDFPHAHGLRRVYPHQVELSAEDQAALEAARNEVAQLSEWHQTVDEIPNHVDVRFCELEAEVDRLEAKRHAYDPDDVVRGGAFVILGHDGDLRIERGFIRPEDDKPRSQPEQAGEASELLEADGADGEAAEGGEEGEESATDDEEEDCPLSDLLVRDLTAYRTLGLRLNLSEHPNIAIVAVTHALAAQIFYVGANAHVVGIQPVRTDLASHAVESRIPRPGKRGRTAMPIGQGSCRATLPACGPSSSTSITTAAWFCSRIARRSPSMRSSCHGSGGRAPWPQPTGWRKRLNWT